MFTTLKKGILVGLLAVGLLAGCSTNSEPKKATAKEPVTIMLDWTPNTNHTGLFVAEALGYFEEEGVSVEIASLPEGDSAADIVANNRAQFGIYFQDYLAKKLVKGAPITAVAAIIEHNTSGILTTADVTTLPDLAGKTYGTWADPLELAMLKDMVTPAVYDQLKQVNNEAADSVSAIENQMFDAAWIYYGWDGILAEQEKVATNFFLAADQHPTFDFYSPLIIASNDYLKENPKEAKKVIAAVKKGYQYAIQNPKEAADILLKKAPELKGKKDFVYASQAYLSERYASDPEKWGQIDPERWNGFYRWVNDLDLFEGATLEDNVGFTNDLVN